MRLALKVLIAVPLIFALIRIYQRQKQVQSEYIINLVMLSRVWFLGALVFGALYILYGFLTISHVKYDLAVDIIVLAFTVFLCALSILFCRWHINIDNNRIEYCSLSGKCEYRYFNQITNAEIDEKDNIYLYSENEKVLKIPIETGRGYITAELRNQGVCIRYRYNIDEFVMKLPLFYPVMYMCFSIIISSAALYSIKENILVGVLFWSVIDVCLIAKTISDFLVKVIVDKNAIVQVKFFRKKKIYYYQIVRVMRRERNNIPYLYIYSQEGLKLRINMLCKNKKLMEEFIKKHQWEQR